MKPNVEVCRVFAPQDANLYGIVHGGTILQLISEASYIACYKHFNQLVEACEVASDLPSNNQTAVQPPTSDSSKNPQIIQPIVCRIEHTDFLLPAMIGDLGVARAKVVFTSGKSCRVYVEIFSGKIVGQLNLVSYSILWYIGGQIDPTTKIVTSLAIPKVSSANLVEFEQESRMQYEQNKSERQKAEAVQNNEVDFEQLKLTFNYLGVNTDRSVSDYSTAIHLRISAEKCSPEGFVLGGILLKTMDEVGALTAFKFSNQYVVTGCIEAVDFHYPAKIGDILLVLSRVVFSSQRSVDVQVLVYIEDFFKDKCRKLICSSNYVYVLRPSKTGFTPLPSITPTTPQEQALYEAAETRYKTRKHTRSPTKYSPIFD